MPLCKSKSRTSPFICGRARAICMTVLVALALATRTAGRNRVFEARRRVGLPPGPGAGSALACRFLKCGTIRRKLTSSIRNVLSSITVQCFSTGTPVRRSWPKPRLKAVPGPMLMPPIRMILSTVDCFQPRLISRTTWMSAGGSVNSVRTHSQVVVGFKPYASGSGGL